MQEDPNQVIAQSLCLLQPHTAKWRIVANAFSISPDSLGKRDTDEDYLRAILVQCVDQHDFQFNLKNIVDLLKKEAEEETEMTTNKQGSHTVILIMILSYY